MGLNRGTNRPTNLLLRHSFILKVN